MYGTFNIQIISEKSKRIPFKKMPSIEVFRDIFKIETVTDTKFYHRNDDFVSFIEY